MDTDIDELMLRLQLAVIRDSLAMARRETNRGLRAARLAQVCRAYDAYAALYEEAHVSAPLPTLYLVPGSRVSGDAALTGPRVGASHVQPLCG